jgi:alanine dehydrogenase
MRIGVPKEVKTHEYRVGMTPTSVRELVLRGHEVVVERDAGHAIGLDDDHYRGAGARVVDTAAEVFATAEMIVKVKEPQEAEIGMLRAGQILFTYLHLAPDADLTRRLLDAEIIGIAYETVSDERGGLPLLAPMSEVAGRMAIQAGAHCLEIEQGGRGTLLSGVPGVSVGRVVILGGGVVGTNAARMAMGLEASVTVIDKSLQRLYDLDMRFGATLNTMFSTRDAIEACVAEADLLVGGVLVPGASAPRLISREMVRSMKRGSVIVDVAIDQGGCVETARPTTHQQPTYVVDDVVHYCVTNMPGAVPRTSTFALTNQTLGFAKSIANLGLRDALAASRPLRKGVNTHDGVCTHQAVAEALDLPFEALAS